MFFDRKRKVHLDYTKHHNEIRGSRQKLQHYLDPAKLASLAPYKLAYVITHHKNPFSDCDVCMEFVSAADRQSQCY